MGVIVPLYVSSDTGATHVNAYVALMNNSLPVQGYNANSRGFLRSFVPATSNAPPNQPPSWVAQQYVSHTSIVISANPDASAPPYEVSATLAVFSSLVARNQKLTPVDTIFVKTATDLTTNVAAVLYDAVKAMLPGAVDA